MDGKGGETQPDPVEAVSEVPKGYLAEEAKSEIRFLGRKISPCLRNEAVKEDCTRTLEENNASVMEQSGQDPVGLTEVKRDVDGALTPERRLSEHISCVRQLQREMMMIPTRTFCFGYLQYFWHTKSQVKKLFKISKTKKKVSSVSASYFYHHKKSKIIIF